MRIRIDRASRASLRDQIRAQMEFALLTGELTPGARLPSTRSLARRLDVHPNTVSQVFKDLLGTGNFVAKTGSGMFVRPQSVGDRALSTHGHDLRRAVASAIRDGMTAEEVRATVNACLTFRACTAILIVDPAAEMRAIYETEISRAARVPVGGASIDDIKRSPSLATDKLVAVLPHHELTVRLALPNAHVVVLRFAELARILDSVRPYTPLTALGVVSESPILLSFAAPLLSAAFGAGVSVETALLGSSGLARFVSAVDCVLADAVAARRLRDLARRKLVIYPVLDETSVLTLTSYQPGLGDR